MKLGLKYARLEALGIPNASELPYNETIKTHKNQKFSFVKLNIEDRENLPSLFANQSFDVVCNLAAQAGVRYSIENPENLYRQQYCRLFKYLRSLQTPQR